MLPAFFNFYYSRCNTNKKTLQRLSISLFKIRLGSFGDNECMIIWTLNTGSLILSTNVPLLEELAIFHRSLFDDRALVSSLLVNEENAVPWIFIFTSQFMSVVFGAFHTWQFKSLLFQYHQRLSLLMLMFIWFQSLRFHYISWLHRLNSWQDLLVNFHGLHIISTRALFRSWCKCWIMLPWLHSATLLIFGS